jgi:hypothetical protein
MNIRSIVVAAVAFAAVSAAYADEPAPKPAKTEAPRVETALAELTAGMREVLRAVTPEISLPALELKLPKLDPARR